MCLSFDTAPWRPYIKEAPAIRAVEIAGAIFLYLNVTAWIRSVSSAKVPVLESD